ncbi:MAG: BlaI/MecI/CopY family transcriptional regulator [Phycisphaerae bacterium]
MGDPQPDLGAAELEVLRVLWDEGPRTVREVLGALHARGRKVAYTTVLTMLSRLEQKGFVSARRGGLAHVYRARISRARVTRVRLRSLLDQLFDGAAGPLVLELLQSQRLNREEIDELRALVSRLESQGRSDGRDARG